MSEYSVYVNDNGTPRLVTVGDLEKLISAAKEQAFTDEEKAQARKNINALGVGEVDFSGLVKSVNSIKPGEDGGVTIDVGVKSVFNESADSTGNVSPNIPGRINGLNPLTSAANDTLAFWNAQKKGWYWVDPNSYIGVGTGVYGHLLHSITVVNEIFQIFITAPNGTVYKRGANASGFTAWQTMYSSATGVPVGKITGLQIGATTMTRTVSSGLATSLSMSVSRDNYGRLTGTSFAVGNCNCNCDCNCDCADSDSDGG